LRILIASHYYLPYRSGLSEYARLLARGLRERGHQLRILCVNHTRRLPLQEVIEQIPVRRAEIVARFSKGCLAPGFAPLLQRLAARCDAVILGAPLPDLLPCVWAVPSPKLILTYHCDLDLGPGPLRRTVLLLYRFSLWLALRRRPAVVVNSADYARRSWLGDYAGPLAAIPPPIKPLRRVDPAPLRAEWKLEGRRVVGFLGRLVAEKGLPVLLRAWPRVLHEHPNAVLVLAGEGKKVAGGSELDSLRSTIRSFGDNVRLVGPIPETRLAEFYSLCDAFAFPSVAPLESFGMVQIEAMRCGVPVAASDLPGVREPVERTGMGLVTRAGDAADLAAALSRLLRAPDDFRRSLERIEAHFSLERTAAGYESLIRARLGRGAPT